MNILQSQLHSQLPLHNQLHPKLSSAKHWNIADFSVAFWSIEFQTRLRFPCDPSRLWIIFRIRLLFITITRTAERWWVDRWPIPLQKKKETLLFWADHPINLFIRGRNAVVNIRQITIFQRSWTREDDHCHRTSGSENLDEIFCWTLMHGHIKSY